MPRPSKHNSPLAQFRKKMRLTQAALAGVLGVGRESVSKLEAKNDVSDEVRKRLKAEFGEEDYRWLSLFESGDPGTEPVGDNLNATCAPCTSLLMPVVIEMETTNPNSESIDDIQCLLGQLINLPEQNGDIQIKISMTYKASFFDTRQDLVDKLFACLLKNNESVIREPRRPRDSSDVGHFKVRTLSSDRNPITVSIRGLDRFPKVPKVPLAMPFAVVNSTDPFQRYSKE